MSVTVYTPLKIYFYSLKCLGLIQFRFEDLHEMDSSRIRQSNYFIHAIHFLIILVICYGQTNASANGARGEVFMVQVVAAAGNCLMMLTVVVQLLWYKRCHRRIHQHFVQIIDLDRQFAVEYGSRIDYRSVIRVAMVTHGLQWFLFVWFMVAIVSTLNVSILLRLFVCLLVSIGCMFQSVVTAHFVVVYCTLETMLKCLAVHVVEGNDLRAFFRLHLRICETIKIGNGLSGPLVLAQFLFCFVVITLTTYMYVLDTVFLTSYTKATTGVSNLGLLYSMSSLIFIAERLRNAVIIIGGLQLFQRFH